MMKIPPYGETVRRAFPSKEEFIEAHPRLKVTKKIKDATLDRRSGGDRRKAEK
jgi:hypothetical protein